ncbi:MAG: winged helix DNA-binding protein [Nitrosopumilus sp.]|nr:winged helix DNA-binding protein [Nitrosopumilus sp.]MDH3486700.1 winged helix DNA-binding protein [Nitrosopumilus sp.]
MSLKCTYRSEMGILSDILTVTREEGQNGIIISAISRKANLSHYAAVDKCNKLIEAELMKKTTDEKNRLFILTEKGRSFFEELERFQNLMKSLKLKY